MPAHRHGFVARRTKEIGIRKVLGASEINLLTLLSGEFGKLLLIGFLISLPVAWFVMNQWLQDFAFRTSISLGTFVAAGGIMLLVAAVTISFQLFNAARTNPVDCLKEQ